MYVSLTFTYPLTERVVGAPQKTSKTVFVFPFVSGLHYPLGLGELQASSFPDSVFVLLIIIIYPLSAKVAGAPQMISKPVFSIFPCSPLHSGTC